MSYNALDIRRFDEDPCPECGCPFLYEVVRDTRGTHRAWRDKDGEWYCGAPREVIEVGCVAIACDWVNVGYFRNGKPSITLEIEEGEIHGIENRH